MLKLKAGKKCYILNDSDDGFILLTPFLFKKRQHFVYLQPIERHMHLFC